MILTPQKLVGCKLLGSNNKGKHKKKTFGMKIDEMQKVEASDSLILPVPFPNLIACAGA